ncbi:siderophore-interacting protein [Actinoalloteichus fjordicus]|uniref:Siderophore-interacting protein n=1 Tax=Actinoalloteichus fjordicus TaxID=1612552 RepID=A0AAC9PTP7_9PSEU|nr:siderophore-interacting protein [Actinoalloteichus fjordicus]APU16116.1 siderophore-interacting protein [Actinoalloteichus fjordicus]
MSSPSRFERIQHTVLTKAVSLVMAPPNERREFHQFPMTVDRVVDLAPNLRRITFHAPGFHTFGLTGPDEYFGLLIPPRHGAALAMPDADRLNVRQAIRGISPDERPELRWYTVRALRADVGEIDVDFVLHGDTGPASRWAGAALPGAVAGFRAGTSTYRPRTGAGLRLLAADETALPALSSILESLPHDDVDVRAFVELPAADYRQPVDSPIPVTWLYRGSDAPGSRLLDAVRDIPLDGLGYAWACGESALATGLRRHLVKERGVDRRRIMFSGYWRLGRSRE